MAVCTHCNDIEQLRQTVADPGFPMGGCRAVGGVPTSDAGTFQQKRMQK